MNIKHWMIYVIVIFGLVTLGFYVSSFFVEDDWVEIVGVSCLTAYYQICLRPLIGSFINLKYHNQMNYNRRWFKVGKVEEKIYKILHVKKWKKFLPTYDKEAFDYTKHTNKEIVMTMCQAEIVHELMLVASLPPLLLIIPYGRPLVFILTTIACVLVELLFIILQRFNRPRVLKLMKLRKEI